MVRQALSHPWEWESPSQVTVTCAAKWRHSNTAVPSFLHLLQLCMLSTTSHEMGCFFGQLGTTFSALSASSSLPTQGCLAGGMAEEAEKALMPCKHCALKWHENQKLSIQKVLKVKVFKKHNNLTKQPSVKWEAVERVTRILIVEKMNT